MLTNVHNAEVLHLASKLAKASLGIAMALAWMLIGSCGDPPSNSTLTDSGLEIMPMHMNLERVTFGESTTGVFKIKNIFKLKGIASSCMAVKAGCCKQC